MCGEREVLGEKVSEFLLKGERKEGREGKEGRMKEWRRAKL